MSTVPRPARKRMGHGFPVSHNFYVHKCLKFMFANVEAIHERSLVRVEVEPCSTSCLSSALFILPLFYLRD